MSKKKDVLSFIVGFFGLFILALYWWKIGGLTLPLGSGGDSCFDVLRQEVAQQLSRHHWMTFWSQSFMAPTGIWIPYVSWTIERDLIGALFWWIWPGAPYVAGYFLVSLILSYGIVGYILKRIGVGSIASWILACFFLLFNPARHLKTWYHFEFLPQHWLYLGFFLDVWIWTELTSRRKWNLNLEAWRVFIFLGNFFSTGYFWSIGILEYVLVRIGIGILFWFNTFCLEKKKSRFEIVFPNLRSWILPGVGSLILLSIEIAWYLPLWHAVRNFPVEGDYLGYTTKFPKLFAPVFLPLERLDNPETLVTAGWSYWIPAFLGFWAVWKRRGWKGFVLKVAPFLILLGIACAYMTRRPEFVALAMKDFFPFMKFFRVAARWGLVLPLILSSLICLCWADLKEVFIRLSIGAKAVMGTSLVVILIFELNFLTYPVYGWQSLDASVSSFLKAIQKMPGERLLDLPFCVAGGNGICAEKQCPNYPDSLQIQCFRMWHEKQVYGIYQARMNPESCEIYGREPFTSWFSAWKEKRCFHPDEWKAFCDYLDQDRQTSRTDSRLSGILVHSDIWKEAGSDECFSQFERHLGKPILRAPNGNLGQLFFFRPHCVEK